MIIIEVVALVEVNPLLHIDHYCVRMAKISN